MEQVFKFHWAQAQVPKVKLVNFFGEKFVLVFGEID